MLSDNQWGFRGGRSTVSAFILTTMDWFASLESGNDICAVFFDYQKAFDSVPHRPLLAKPSSLQLSPYLIRWITNYLTNRLQHVVVEGEKSSTAHVLSGVPQGSVLGPLLFLIYVDGVSSITLSQGSKCNLFADDLLLFKVLSHVHDFIAIQEDIS